MLVPMRYEKAPNRFSYLRHLWKFHHFFEKKAKLFLKNLAQSGTTVTFEPLDRFFREKPIWKAKILSFLKI